MEWCEEACELLSSMHSNYHARFNQQSDAANHVKRARPTKRGRTRTAKAHQDGRYPLHFSEHTDISAVPDSATVNVPVRTKSLLFMLAVAPLGWLIFV